MIHFTGSTDPGDPTRSGESDEIPCMICGGYGTRADMGNYDVVCNDCAPRYVIGEIIQSDDAYCNGFMVSRNTINGLTLDLSYNFKSVPRPSESFVDSFEEGMKKILK